MVGKMSFRIAGVLAVLGVLVACASGTGGALVSPEPVERHDPVDSDLAYLTHLALIRGHLHVGVELYRGGYFDHAAMHMKHPGDELYADLIPVFERADLVGFGDELLALSDAVIGQGDVAVVEAAHEQVLAAIAVAERDGVMLTSTPAINLSIVEGLVREAADEYAIGVVDGAVVNVHEYQDSYGFTRIAGALLRTTLGDVSASADTRALANRALFALDGMDNLWPVLVPQGGLEGDSEGLIAIGDMLAMAGG